MNKLYFEGKVLNLYSEDYQYLQDSVDTQLVQVLKSVFSGNSDQGGVIFGFNLEISGADSTKLKVSHENGYGALVSKNALFMYTSTITDNIALSDYTFGVVNSVYAKADQVYGSYNRTTKTIDVGVQSAIDLSTYQNVYNRQLDELSIVCYTDAEYAALSTTEKNKLVFLGSTVAQGSGQPLVSVDATDVIALYVTIADNTILLRHLNPNFMLPQEMVFATSTGKVDDNFFANEVSIQDDLNRLRTELRTIKGTTSWKDTTPGTLLNFDKALNNLHIDGVVQDYGQQFASELVTSTGVTSVIIHPGKILHLGNVYVVPVGTTQVLPLFSVPFYNIGDYITKTDYEEHTVGAAPVSFTLAMKEAGYYLSDDDLHVTAANNTEYALGVDYTFDSNSGVITTVSGGDINNESIRVYYKYSSKRYDTIDITSTGAIEINEGTISIHPQPPLIKAGDFRLYIIERSPFTPTVTADLVDCRSYLQTIRECIEVSPAEHSSVPYTVNKCAYLTSTGSVDTNFSQWGVTSTGVAHSTTSTVGAAVTTEFLVREDDQLWLRASTLPTGGTVHVDFESVVGSDIFDTQYTINLHDTSSTMTDNLIYVDKGISSGYHKCRITLATAGTFIFYGLVYGKLDNIYTKDKVTASQIKTTDLNVTGLVTSSIVISNTTPTMGLGTGALVVESGGTSLGGDLYVKGNIYRDSSNILIDSGNLDNFISDLKARVQKEEDRSIKQELRLSYLEQRQSPDSDGYTETYLDSSNISTTFENASNIPAEVMDDIDWNLDWKYRGADESPNYKNGYMRPRKDHYMLEMIDQFDLDPIGYALKSSISRYDATNDCYWLLSVDVTTLDCKGCITQINSNLVDNSVTVMGQWFLPQYATTATATAGWSGLDTDGSYLYVTFAGTVAADTNLTGRANHVFKFPITTYKGKTVIGSDLTATGGTLSCFNQNASGTSLGTGLVLDATDLYITVTIPSPTTGATYIEVPTAATPYMKPGQLLYSTVLFGATVPYARIVRIGDATHIEIDTPIVAGSTSFRLFGSHTWLVGATVFNGQINITAGATALNEIIDCTVWDSTNLAYFVHTGATVAVNRGCALRFLDVTLSGLPSNSAALSDINLQPSGTNATPALIYNNATFGKSIFKDTQFLWVKVNDVSSDARFIYKIDCSYASGSYTGDIGGTLNGGAVQLKSISGRFECTRGVDEEHNSGITMSKQGDILEVVSTASFGKFLTKRAYKYASWAENQVNYTYRMNASTNPNLPTACLVYGDSVYTGDTAASANEVDLYRFDRNDGTKHSCRLTGSGRSWTNLRDLTTDGTTVWLLGNDGTNYEVVFNTKVVIDTALNLSIDYNASNPLDITGAGWTVSTGIGTGHTGILTSICYNQDTQLLYLLNDSTNTVYSLTLDGATFTAITTLPAGNWQGLAYKNGLFYVHNADSPGYVHAFDLTKSTAASWYYVHTYIEPSALLLANASLGIDFLGNDLVFTGYDTSTAVTDNGLFFGMKTLEDPNALQLQSYFKASTATSLNPSSLLLSNNIWTMTPIAERYFEPYEFSDYRDVPDKYYCAAGYTDEGMTILHLDEYLSGKSSTGKDRYDVRLIRVQHYLRGIGGAGTLFTTAGVNIMGNTAGKCKSLIIEKELIAYGGSPSNGDIEQLVIDLKSSKAYWFAAGAVSGCLYKGNLSERNSGKAYDAATANSLLALSATIVMGPHSAYTFMKNDSSDYDKPYPTTFITRSNNTTGTDIMVFAWDQNNNRVPTRVWKNVFNSADIGAHTAYIAPSGLLVVGDIANSQNALWWGVAPVWTINKHGYYDYTGYDATVRRMGNDRVGLVICPEGTWQVGTIAHNNMVWKSPTGTWRHKILMSATDAAISNYPRIAIVDVENKAFELVFPGVAADTSWYMLDACEDKLFVIGGGFSYSDNYSLSVLKKQRFMSKDGASINPATRPWANGWTTYYGVSNPASLNPTVNLQNTFPRPILGQGTGGGNDLAYSSSTSSLTISNKAGGAQIIFFPESSTSVLESKEFTTTNPSKIYYTEHSQLPYVEN